MFKVGDKVHCSVFNYETNGTIIEANNHSMYRINHKKKFGGHHTFWCSERNLKHITPKYIQKWERKNNGY